jgi:hypothetical protein
MPSTVRRGGGGVNDGMGMGKGVPEGGGDPGRRGVPLCPGVKVGKKENLRGLGCVSLLCDVRFTAERRESMSG